MRADLLDAQAVVGWAKAQIPVFQQRIVAWERTRPYRIIKEPDSDVRYELLTATLVKPLDPLAIAEAGAIINSIRSALDILAGALARRNGVNPTSKMHFPIYSNPVDALDPRQGIEAKQWLSVGERSTIKSLKPYKGGDAVLYPLHQLDILRKHERLLTAEPIVAEATILMFSHRLERVMRREDDKTILYRFPMDRRFYPAEGNTGLAANITINEPALGLNHEPALALLRNFAAHVGEIIAIFDQP